MGMGKNFPISPWTRIAWPRARWVRMSRGWGLGAGEGGGGQSEARVRCAAIFALHRVATVGHPCLGQARAGARDERVEWGLMGWGGLDHRSVRRRFSPLAGSREE